MIARGIRLTVAIGIGLAALPALAAEGRIPVFFPGQFLGVDGKYIVTRNIVNPGAGPAIVVGAPNVDLDLNGFVVSNPGTPDPVIVVPIGDHVTIKNGTLVGGGMGIDAPGFLRKADFEDIKIHDIGGFGIHLFDTENAVIRRVEFSDIAGTAIQWDGGAVIKQGTIESNVIRRAANGIAVFGCSSLGVWHNRIEDLTGPPGIGIALTACGSSLVAENTIETVSGDGIFLRQCRGNKLLDNVVTLAGMHGIHIDQATVDTLVLNNNSSLNGTLGPGAGDGLLNEGARSFIERNLFNGNSRYGMTFFGPTACGNTFGGNTARGNTGPGPACGPGPALFPPNSCNTVAACGALPNSTAGANLIPGPPVF